MFFLTEKMLIWSMRLQQQKSSVLKTSGRILGKFPVWYAERMERRLMDGTWHPCPQWKQKGRKRTNNRQQGK